MKGIDREIRAVELASQRYHKDKELEIDIDPDVVWADGGAWVKAWAFIPEADIIPETTVWIAGYNMPGYMPDNEPVECEDFDSAKRYIIGMMKSFEDEDYDRISTLRFERNAWRAGGADWEDKHPVKAAELETLDDKAAEYCHGAERINLCSSEFSHRFGDYVFWVTKS